MGQAQDGITTATDAQFIPNACSYLTSSDKAELTQRFLQPFRALRIRKTESWKLRGLDLSCTGALFAEKTTDKNDETDWTATDWEIVQDSLLATLHPFGDGPTTRTRSSWERCT